MNDKIIYSENNQKILDFLCEHPNDAYYSNQIADKVQLSKGGVSQALRAMVKERLLRLEKKGNMMFYQVESSSPVIRQFKVLRTILSLNPLVAKLQPLSEKIILFGSCAEGDNTDESDIDLLVVSGLKDEARSIIGKFKTKRQLQLILKSPQEYVSLAKKEPVFFAEIERGIPLWQRV